MANLKEDSTWEQGIYQFETSDPVMGGPNGIDNVPTSQLANRTLWLKNQLAAAVQSIDANKSAADAAFALKATTLTAGSGLTGGGTLGGNRVLSMGKPSKITATSTDEAVSDTHSHSIDKASTSVAGIVMLVNALNSTATDRALTAAQGKALADMIGALGDEAFKQRGTLGSRNLDTLKGITNFGVWFMNANSGATTALNYPADRAGALLVLPGAYEGIQLYILWEMAQIYIRNTTQSGAWSDWRIIGEVVNSLTSTSTTAALSAAQGKVLNDKIEQAAPSGEVAYFAGRNAPAGWLKANGAAVSRTAYAALFAAIGTTYGPGDGSTTFNLPDLRGEFMRGWDDGRGIDLGRAFGSAQGDAIRNITGEAKFGYDGDTVYDPNAAASTLAIYYPDRKVQDQVNNLTLTSNAANNWRPLVFDASRAVPTAGENRPRNIALLACIKI